MPDSVSRDLKNSLQICFSISEVPVQGINNFYGYLNSGIVPFFVFFTVAFLFLAPAVGSNPTGPIT